MNWLSGEVPTRREEQQICRWAIENYVARRSEVRATEVAHHVERVTGWRYSPITAARVLGHLGWVRTILNVGNGERAKIFWRF